MRGSRLALLVSLIPLTAAAATSPMHPAVPVRDAAGKGTLLLDEMDPVQTCTGCHDAAWINGHNSHWSTERKADCLTCHVSRAGRSWTADMLDAQGRIPSDKLGIGPPTSSACGQCHGLVHEGRKPLELPPEFDGEAGQDSYLATRLTGVIVSPHRVSESFVNVRDKQAQVRPWDVHAARGVQCISCHYSANSPRKADKAVSGELPYLKRDPRALTMAQYLQRPDHRLVTAQCVSCHEPLAVHENLPYRDRHMEALACQACHVASIPGPAASTIDSTMLDADGTPLVAYRGVDPSSQDPPGVRYMEGYEPFLFPTREDGRGRLAPFNLVTRWYWVDGAGKEVAPEILRVALSDKDQWRPQVVAAFDRDGDGRLARSELCIDDPERSALVASLLAGVGVSGAKIAGSVTSHAISHGVVSGRFVNGDCASCHTRGSRLDTLVPLAAWVPFGAPTDLAIEGDAKAIGTLVGTEGGGLALERSLDEEPVYVLGHSRRSWSDRLGLTLLLLTLLVIGLHTVLRIVGSRRNAARAHARPRPEGQTVYMYSIYERLWHWTMAGSVLVLAWTGLEIHYPMLVSLLGFPAAVTVHNVAAVVMVLNAFLALFYHLATSEIRQFIPPRTDFVPLRFTSGPWCSDTRSSKLGKRSHPRSPSRERSHDPGQEDERPSLHQPLSWRHVAGSGPVPGLCPDRVGAGRVRCGGPRSACRSRHDRTGTRGTGCPFC